MWIRRWVRRIRAAKKKCHVILLPESPIGSAANLLGFVQKVKQTTLMRTKNNKQSPPPKKKKKANKQNKQTNKQNKQTRPIKQTKPSNQTNKTKQTKKTNSTLKANPKLPLGLPSDRSEDTASALAPSRVIARAATAQAWRWKSAGRFLGEGGLFKGFFRRCLY